jgi:Protein of unknown function (DUF2865)
MRIHLRRLGSACAIAVLAAACGHAAWAQGWGGWGDNYYGREQPGNYGREQPGGYSQPPVYGYGAPRPVYGSSNPRCRELEYQLTGGSPNLAGQDQLQRIEGEMRQADAQFRRVQSEAESSHCYEEMFFFGRSLRRTPRCIDLDRQIQAAKSALGQLKAQRDAAQRSNSPKARHDDIVAELARNHCGDQYAREYEAQRSRSSSIFSFFSDEEPDDTRRYTPNYGTSSYRTLCVRECDGFYFPISTAAGENQFRDDEAKCHSQCAAPAELYYHRGDQDVDQMVSMSGRPYSEMPNAFRNRKVYIRGCSCNTSEYSREEIAKSEEALKTGKRADATKTPQDAAFARRISQTLQNAPARAPQGQAAPGEQSQPNPVTTAPGAANTPPAAEKAPPPAAPAR